jgi:hypothetical protein
MTDPSDLLRRASQLTNRAGHEEDIADLLAMSLGVTLQRLYRT